MKRIFIFIVCTFVLLLSGCSRDYYFEFEELSKNVHTIEIIKFEEYDGKLYPDKDKSYELLKILTGEEKDIFLQTLSEIKYEILYGSPHYSPKDICLKLLYEDGSYAYINQNTFLHFNKEGTNYISSKNIRTRQQEFNELIKKYINK